MTPAGVGVSWEQAGLTQNKAQLAQRKPDPRPDRPSQPDEENRRPAWAVPRAILLAEVEDIVSRRSFRAWYVGAEAERSVDGLRWRERPLPFRIEQVDSGRQLGAFGSWSEIEAWHERTVISAGWRIVNALPELGELGSAPSSDR